MKNTIYLLLFISFFACKKDIKTNKLILDEPPVEVIQDSSVFDLSSKSHDIDFAKSPISIKEIVLNEEKFYITSSINDGKYNANFCIYKDYHLERGYVVTSKTNIKERYRFVVYVKDDKYKMIRDKANEEFLSIEITNEFIKPWNVFFVGMHLDSLLPYVISEEYHIDKDDIDAGIINVFSKEFEINFHYQNDIINKIIINRKCDKNSE